MEGLINTIVALSSNPSDLGNLAAQLKSSEPILASNQGALSHSLQALDQAQHSLGVLYILDAQVKAGVAANDAPTFIEYVSGFLQVCNAEHVRAAPPEMFCRLCRKYKELVITAGNPRVGVLPLKAALNCLRRNSEVVTPIHSDFLQMCLLSKCYNAAADIVNEDIFDVDPHKTSMTPTDFFLYGYYGGMICIGRKQYARALELLLQVLTAPAMVCSAITVAAYKKYVLVCLVHTGHLVQLPKFTASKVKTVLEAECRPYNELALAYSSHNPEKLRRVCEQHQPIFTTDGNLGLAKLVQQSLVKRNIQRLTQTYLTLSLSDIASNVGLASPEEAEMHVLRMIAEGEIFAKIDQASDMVRFLEDPQQYNTTEVSEKLANHVARCIQLSKKLQAVHDMVSCDRQYLAKITQKERTRFEATEEFTGAGLFQP